MPEADTIPNTTRPGFLSAGEAADSIPSQLAAQQRRAEKTRQRVCKMREMAFEEIERLIAFIDATDGYTTDEREQDAAESGIADREGLLEQVGSQDWTHTVMG